MQFRQLQNSIFHLIRLELWLGMAELESMIIYPKEVKGWLNLKAWCHLHTSYINSCNFDNHKSIFHLIRSLIWHGWTWKYDYVPKRKLIYAKTCFIYLFLRFTYTLHSGPYTFMLLHFLLIKGINYLTSQKNWCARLWMVMQKQSLSTSKWLDKEAGNFLCF